MRFCRSQRICIGRWRSLPRSSFGGELNFSQLLREARVSDCRHGFVICAVVVRPGATRNAIRFRRRSAEVLLRSVLALLSGVLCVLIVGQPMVAAASVKKAVGPSAQQIRGDERVLQVLNRFTFGPRQGDITAVRAMGVRGWFERQLNPLSIDDSALEARLAMFPAMQMEQELMRRCPDVCTATWWALSGGWGAFGAAHSAMTQGLWSSLSVDMIAES
jgi:hypothetical protein